MAEEDADVERERPDLHADVIVPGTEPVAARLASPARAAGPTHATRRSTPDAAADEQ
jgi:hypothetical protein